MPANLENSAVATGLTFSERSVFIPIPKKGSAKNAQTTEQLHSFHLLANSVQSLSCVLLSVTALTTALQASLSKTHSWSYPSPTPGARLNSCPSSWWCNPTIFSSVDPFSSYLQCFPASVSFLSISSLHQVGKVLELELQHQYFQWIFRINFL